MPWNRFVLGYHGCDESIVEDVLLGRKGLKTSLNQWDWLGNGIYFWEDSYRRALQWAKGSERVNKPAVIGAVINLGHCLNLLDVEHLDTVKRSYMIYKQMCEQGETALFENTGLELKNRKLDCAVMETLHYAREIEEESPYETVRGFFIEGKPLYSGAGLRQQDHIQLCVRDKNCIVGYFLPKSKT